MRPLYQAFYIVCSSLRAQKGRCALQAKTALTSTYEASSLDLWASIIHTMYNLKCDLHGLIARGQELDKKSPISSQWKMITYVVDETPNCRTQDIMRVKWVHIYDVVQLVTRIKPGMAESVNVLLVRKRPARCITATCLEHPMIVHDIARSYYACDQKFDILCIDTEMSYYAILRRATVLKFYRTSDTRC